MNKVLLELVANDQVPQVLAVFQRSIEESYITHPMRHATKAETKRRFHICLQILEKLRVDYHWSIPRILDHVSPYLRAQLDSVPYIPSNRKSWAAGGVEAALDIGKLPPRVNGSRLVGPNGQPLGPSGSGCDTGAASPGGSDGSTNEH